MPILTKIINRVSKVATKITMTFFKRLDNKTKTHIEMKRKEITKAKAEITAWYRYKSRLAEQTQISQCLKVNPASAEDFL